MSAVPVSPVLPTVNTVAVGLVNVLPKILPAPDSAELPFNCKKSPSLPSLCNTDQSFVVSKPFTISISGAADNPWGTFISAPVPSYLTILIPALAFALTIDCAELLCLVPMFNVSFCDAVSLYKFVTLAAFNSLLNILNWSISPSKYKSVLYFLYPITKLSNVRSVIVTLCVANKLLSL